MYLYMKIDRVDIGKGLMKIKRAELIRGLKVVGVSGVNNLKKSDLVNKMMDEMEKGKFKQYEADKTILVIREALGLSTHGNLKSRTAGIRKSKKDDAKSASQLANESLSLMKDAMRMEKRKPKLSKDFIKKIKKELELFENEINKITN